MNETLVKVDAYLRRRDTLLARGLRRISPKEGSAYRTSQEKNILERAIAVPAAVITAPLVGAVALAVKLEDGGRSFYRHPRIGRDGKIFGLLKIRSLQEGADQNTEVERAIAHNVDTVNDPRSTKTGTRIRRLRLDELPQFWQILTGKVALFGMRAATEQNFQTMNDDRSEGVKELYDDYIQGRPGTVNPQTAFNPGCGSDAERYHYDTWYLRREWLGLNLYMLFRTVANLLDGELKSNSVQNADKIL